MLLQTYIRGIAQQFDNNNNKNRTGSQRLLSYLRIHSARRRIPSWACIPLPSNPHFAPALSKDSGSAIASTRKSCAVTAVTPDR